MESNILRTRSKARSATKSPRHKVTIGNFSNVQVMSLKQDINIPRNCLRLRVLVAITTLFVATLALRREGFDQFERRLDSALPQPQKAGADR